MLYDESVEKNGAYIEKSFEDLQKFIELEDDKERISLWVTKVLFFNKAYDEAHKSIKKVSTSILDHHEELIKIEKFLNVYEGAFEDGGVLGRIVMNAFDGTYQPNSIEINESRHQITESDFIEENYRKWLQILNLYSQGQYQPLIKLLQREIF